MATLLALLGGAAPLRAEEAPAPTAEADPSAEQERPASPDPQEGLVHDPSEASKPQWGRGPFEVSDPYILALYRARPWATSPEVLPHLKGSISLRGVWSNSYAFERNRMAIDAETRNVFFTARFGIGDRFQAGVHVDYQWRGGGVLDGFIEGFHDAFSLPQADRGRRPRDRYLVAGLQADGATFQLDHAGYGLGDLVLEGRGQVTKGSALLPALTGTLRIRLPTGSGKFELSDGIDWTLGLDASKRIGESDFVLYAGASYTYHDERLIDGLELSRHRGFFYVGGEWEIVPRLSFVVHVWIESKRETLLWAERAGVPPTKILVGNWITYVAGGFKFEPLDGLTFELGAMENMIDPEVTADWTMMFNVTLEL